MSQWMGWGRKTPALQLDWSTYHAGVARQFPNRLRLFPSHVREDKQEHGIGTGESGRLLGEGVCRRSTSCMLHVSHFGMIPKGTTGKWRLHDSGLALPFSLRSAPKIFNAVADAVEWIARYLEV